MPSLYSANLKIELMTTGDKSGVWGSITNSNLGSTSSASSGIEQAIVGKATLLTADFTANVATFTLIDDPNYQVARALYLQVDATLSAAGTINVPSIQKPYLVFNNSVGGFAVTIKVTGLGGGVSVPNGKKTWVYTDGANSVLSAVDYLPTLALGTALPTSSGGTGQSSYTAGDLTYYASGTSLTKLPIGASTYVLASSGTAPQWVAPSTIPAGTATNLAGGAAGSLPYQSGASTTIFLPIGTTNFVLTAGASAPQYVAQSTLSVGTASNIAGGATNKILYQSSAGTTAFVDAPTVNGTSILYNSGTNSLYWGLGPAASSASALSGGTAGDLVYQSATSVSSFISDVAVGNALISGGVGVVPSYGKIGLTTHISGTLPIANGGTGTTSTTFVNLTTNVTGTLPIANGGTGTTSTTFVNLTTNVTGTLPIANGGTNSTATATAGGIGYGTGTAHAYTAAGDAGQVLTSNAASAPTWQTPSSQAFVAFGTTGGW